MSNNTKQVQNLLDELNIKYKKDKNEPAFVAGFEHEDNDMFDLLIYVDENLERLTFMFHLEDEIKDLEKAKELILDENGDFIVYGCLSILDEKYILYRNNVSVINRTIEKEEFNDYIMYVNYLFEKLSDWEIY